MEVDEMFDLVRGDSSLADEPRLRAESRKVGRLLHCMSSVHRSLRQSFHIRVSDEDVVVSTKGILPEAG